MKYVVRAGYTVDGKKCGQTVEIKKEDVAKTLLAKKIIKKK